MEQHEHLSKAHQQGRQPNDPRIREAPATLLPTVLARLGPELPQNSPEVSLASLMQALSSPDWTVRVWALQMLGKRGEDVPVVPLLAVLDDEDASVRATAVRVLGNLGKNVPVFRLMLALHDPDWHVRETAVFALRNLRERTSVESVKAALYDEDPYVREAARLVLGNGYVEELPHLLANAREAPQEWDHLSAGDVSIGEVARLNEEDSRTSARSRERAGENQSAFLQNEHKSESQEVMQAFEQKMHKQMRGAAPNRTRGRMLQQRLSTVAAVLFLTLLVGSMVITLNLAHSRRSGTARSLANPADTSSIYFYSGDTVYKFDTERKTVAWSTRLVLDGSGWAGDYPLIPYHDIIYVSGSIREGPIVNSYQPAVGYVFAISAKSGALLWRSRIDSAVVHFPGQPDAKVDLGYTSQPVVANGLVYIISRTGKVYALDATTGAKRWVYDTHHTIIICVDLSGNVDSNGPNCAIAGDSDVMVVEHGVLYGTIVNLVFALNAESGSKLWSTSISRSQGIQRWLAVSNSLLYATSIDYTQLFRTTPTTVKSYVYAFNATTGKQLWSTNKLPGLLTAPVASNGAIYVGSQDGSLYAFNGSSGSLLWRQSLGDPVSSPPMVNNDLLYVFTSTRTSVLFAIHTANGAVRWQRQIDGFVSYIQVVTNGVIYLVLNTAILAYRTSDGQQF